MCTIGEKIAELRKNRKMTQEELANVIGVSSQSISKWENNTTMPDILLLPIIAEIFEVTLDELFSIEKTQKTKCIPMEETPLAVYDAVLDTMWAGQEADIKKIKGSLSNNPDQHTGFVSMQRGVYADRENAADFLYMLANPDVRKIMKYQLENRGVTYTLSSVSAKCGIQEENAKTALEWMVKYSLSRKQMVDMGTGERIDIYSHWGDHKFPLLIYPLLSLAEKLSDFKENWCGFRS